MNEIFHLMYTYIRVFDFRTYFRNQLGSKFEYHLYDVFVYETAVFYLTIFLNTYFECKNFCNALEKKQIILTAFTICITTDRNTAIFSFIQIV